MSDNQPSPANDELITESDYERLRHLIVGHEAALVEELQQRLENKQLRTDDLAEVLEAALRQSHANGANLAQAIEEPVQVCLKKSIERDTQIFADALFPVMGPAIRKAISESLKGLIQSINTTVENSVSAKGIKWRVESMRTGVSFGEIVLRNTLVYRVEQVLLVQRDSGLLMQHIAREDIDHQDGDAVSAMLTAIQDFVRDSFSSSDQEAQSDLASVELGDKTVWLLGHANTTMACVIRGIAPPTLREELQLVFERLLSNYKRQLDEFEGDRETLEIVSPVLRECFEFEQRHDEDIEEDDKPSILNRIVKAPAFYLFLALFGWLAWFAYKDSIQTDQRNDLINKLNNQAGIVVLEHSWIRPVTYKPYRHLYLSALKDPGVALESTLFEQHGWNQNTKDQNLFIKWVPYYSLDSEVILTKVKSKLGLPSTSLLSLSNDIVYVKGDIDEVQASSAQAYSGGIEGVDQINIDEANIIYDIDYKKIDNLISRIEDTAVYFSVRLEKAPSFDETIVSLVQEIKALTELTQNAKEIYSLTLIGHADLSGGEQLNQQVRNERAQLVRDLLLEGGLEIPINIISAEDVDVPIVDRSYRRVDLKVTVDKEK